MPFERTLEPSEKENCYVFKANVSATIEGYVWATSYEEAEELIRSKSYDDLEHIEIEEIEEIEEMKEE